MSTALWVVGGVLLGAVLMAVAGLVYLINVWWPK